MYDGEPYREEIERARAAVSIPVIANGGVFSVINFNASCSSSRLPLAKSRCLYLLVPLRFFIM